MTIQVVLWKWKQPNFRHAYTSEHANVVHDMVRRNAGGLDVRIICVTDDPVGLDPRIVQYPLWNDFHDLPNRSGAQLPSCYRRLKLFDCETQEDMGIGENDRIVSLDLDTVVSGPLLPLWTKHQHFIGWAVRGNHHLRVFNGSMWMFSARTHQHMWSNFDPRRTPDRVHKAGYLGSDQSWLSYNFARDSTAGTWAYPQVVSYPKEVARRPMLAKGTSVVMFHGKKKPWHPDVQAESPWVAQHFCLGEVSKPPSAAVQLVAAGGKARITA